MDSTQLRKRLEHSGHALASVLEKVDSAEAAWKPTGDRWSLVEIVNHLIDEEREDFRLRLQSVHEDPSRDWPTIDPMGWIETRRYSSRDYADSFAAWKHERGVSLEWLAHTSHVDPSARYSGAGSDRLPLAAGDLMVSWLGHDYFHLRQISLLRWEYLDHTGAPYSSEYAGPKD